MSKADEFAYSKYPKSKKGVLYDLARNSIIQGYQQAEKDNELTPEDISTIYSLIINAVFELRSENPSFKGEDIYQEVLKRFKKNKL